MTLKTTVKLARSNIAALIEARHGDPFAVLGPHKVSGRTVLRALVPRAESLEVLDSAEGTVIATLARIDPAGLFEGVILGKPVGFAYRLRAANAAGAWEFDDPYRFGPVLGELDDYLIGEGTHRQLWEKLGSHVIEHTGVTGAHFAVWAPNATRVSVVGDFNQWDGRRHPMRLRRESGIWEIFLPGIGQGERYKYEIKNADGNLVALKADPYGYRAEMRPATASIVDHLPPELPAGNEERRRANALDAPVSIYEVHLGSWRRVPEEGNRFLNWRELGDTLISYAVDMGFT